MSDKTTNMVTCPIIWSANDEYGGVGVIFLYKNTPHYIPLRKEAFDLCVKDAKITYDEDKVYNSRFYPYSMVKNIYVPRQ